MWAQEFLPNTFAAPSPRNDSCAVVNPGDSDETSAVFPSWDDMTSNVGPDDFTVYDQAVQYPTPVFFSVWLKEGAGASPAATTTGDVTVTVAGWADTRVVCLPANVTSPGSRDESNVVLGGTSSTAPATPTTTGKKGAAGRVDSMGMGLGVVGLTVLVALVF